MRLTGTVLFPLLSRLQKLASSRTLISLEILFYQSAQSVGCHSRWPVEIVGKLVSFWCCDTPWHTHDNKYRSNRFIFFCIHNSRRVINIERHSAIWRVNVRNVTAWGAWTDSFLRTDWFTSIDLLTSNWLKIGRRVLFLAIRRREHVQSIRLHVPLNIQNCCSMCARCEAFELINDK